MIFFFRIEGGGGFAMKYYLRMQQPHESFQVERDVQINNNYSFGEGGQKAAAEFMNEWPNDGTNGWMKYLLWFSEIAMESC